MIETNFIDNYHQDIPFIFAARDQSKGGNIFVPFFQRWHDKIWLMSSGQWPLNSLRYEYVFNFKYVSVSQRDTSCTRCTNSP